MKESCNAGSQIVTDYDGTLRRAFGSVIRALSGDRAFEGRSEAEMYDAAVQNFMRQILLSVKQAGARRTGVQQVVDYDVLAAERIGRIYENLLDFEVKRVTPYAAGEGAAPAGKLCLTRGRRRRARGSHYTPYHLTERTVQLALEPLVYVSPTDEERRDRWRLRPAEELLQLKIADISCGCGAFLLQVCRYLSERLLEAWEQSGERNLPVDEKDRLLHARRMIARHCLYGVDIDEFAVEIAKHSLWLFTKSRGQPRDFLADRLLCGDSLIDRRVDSLGGEKPFNWRRAFRSVFEKDAGFDAIVGNPPYVSLYARESQSANFAPPFVDYAKRHLGHIDGKPVMKGRVNTYLLFLVRSMQLLDPAHGVAALVLPDTILTNESYEPMRRVLTENGRLLHAVRYQAAMFRGASVGTAIVVCGARSPGRSVHLSEGRAEGAAAKAIRTSSAAVARRLGCSWLPQKSSHIARVSLPERGTVPIGEFAFIKDGINPGSKRTREWLLTDRADDDPSLRLCLEGSWIEPFRITRKELWVRYDPERLTREERKAGASLREPWIFESPKIVYRQTAPNIVAAVDVSGLCARNSVHSIVLKEHDETLLYALLTFLNSQTCRDYYQSVTGETRKTFPQVHISSVKRLRVPECLLDVAHPQTRHAAELARKISTSSGPASSALLQSLDEAAAQLVASVRGRRPVRPPSADRLY